MKREGTTLVQALVAVLVGLLILDVAWAAARFATGRAGNIDRALDRSREQDRIARRLASDLAAACAADFTESGLRLSVVDPAWEPTSLKLAATPVYWRLDGPARVLRRNGEELGLAQLSEVVFSPGACTLRWDGGTPVVLALPAPPERAGWISHVR